MTDRRAEDDDLNPLVVKPKVAWRMLACSNTKGYELLAARELESYKEGRSRKITVASIKALVARRLAESDYGVAYAKPRGSGGVLCCADRNGG